MPTLLGIDIGGSGIKGAPVDVATGELLTGRHRVASPQPATPEAVTAAVGEVASFFDWTGPAGVGFPGVVKTGVAHTAAHLDPAWIGADVAALLGSALGAPVVVLNDADAAGLGEAAFGAARGVAGVCIVITLGTGIGSAVLVDGVLVPNTELGHMDVRGKEAERRAAESVRESKALSWREYAERVDEFLGRLEALFSPDLFVIGGGVSREADKFLGRLSCRTRIVPAALRNNAGIVGAALAASRALTPTR